MSGKHSQVAQELSKFAEALWLELPAAAARQVLGGGSGEAVREAGWKAYDAWISLANEATNQVYENPSVGGLVGRTMETALRVQQAGSALASAFFGNLWPAVGLPTRGEIEALRNEVAALRPETIGSPTSRGDQASDYRPPAHPADVLRAVRPVSSLHAIKRSDEDAAA